MKRLIILTTLIFMAGTIVSNAQDTKLVLGNKAPHFSAKADNGKDWKSEDVIGKKNLVVYFYPAAMTGGCTMQACAYRDAQEQFASLNTEVIGISGDVVENLKWFKLAENLNFTLLSDPKGSIAAKFGVPVVLGEKSIEREVEGTLHTLSRSATTSRWTFVIDKTGEIVYKSTEVKAAEDSNNVLEVLKKLN